ncbi:hypothetical protein PHLCEN_2v6293 [Hermanssonia centrifuga]|uniref:Uncharacterized protein n=1 Tax=Hermanssonia centrifuga TaxID=98765 RepID=A0A2R6NZW4_9APHY|nr:hypothetical protein PHLCEN_2v6293 [Hermanssonia centrifuga]
METPQLAYPEGSHTPASAKPITVLLASVWPGTFCIGAGTAPLRVTGNGTSPHARQIYQWTICGKCKSPFNWRS